MIPVIFLDIHARFGLDVVARFEAAKNPTAQKLHKI